MNTNVIPMQKDHARELRRMRGEFIRALIEDDDRSARYVAIQIGLNPTSMGERLKGKSPFLADELEGVARALKLDPVKLYADYISVGPAGIEPTTSTVESGRFDNPIVSLSEWRARESPGSRGGMILARLSQASITSA